ncbi:hypothetical protein FRB90_011500 [Tulasnella sp. 427]|nr:hypothetical protein FRB90_011500 [Tulasnella sp. 427]
MTSPQDAASARQRPQSPVPPPTVGSILGRVFGFQLPSRGEDNTYARQHTSSTLTEDPVVTPPTGLSLRDLAGFNGYRNISNHLSTTLSSDTVPSTTFAFQPPGSPPTAESPVMFPPHISLELPFAHRPPPDTQSAAVTRASQDPSQRSPLTRASIQHSEHASWAQVAIESGSLPTWSAAGSSTSFGAASANRSAKRRRSFREYKIGDLEIGREIRHEIQPEIEAPLSVLELPFPKEGYWDDVEDSPYPEVRASVSNTDDVDMPCLTLRVITTIQKQYGFKIPLGTSLHITVMVFLRMLDTPYIVINQLFGSVSGLGMSVLTFDWNQIAYIGSPLVTPFWSQINIVVGFVLFYWIMAPAIYYLDIWKTGHLPISGIGGYDRFGNEYDITRIITHDHRLNQTAYDEYSPLYLPVTFAMTYLIAFALSTGLLVHTVIFHAGSILRRAKGKETDENDIHAMMMKKYPNVPSWWSGFVIFGSAIMGVVAVAIDDVGIPVWAPFVAFLITILYSIPSGYVYAMTGQCVPLNLIAQAIPGALFPGSAIGNMIFKTFTTQSATNMQNSLFYLKTAHYIKCNERAVFSVQVIGVLLATSSAMLVTEMLLDKVPDLCNAHQADSLSCPTSMVLYTASIVCENRGLNGPARQFGKGSIYQILPFATVLGALLPIVLWLWLKRYPTSRLKYGEPT